MRVRDLMTPNPTCCTPRNTIQEAARLMNEWDCGEIPVVRSADSKKPAGVITDRDICCRAVADGKAPDTKVEECMSRPAVTVGPDADLDECCRLMEEKQIRRIVVVDRNGDCCGIIAQADIASSAPHRLAAEVLQELSRPAGEQPRSH